MDNFLLYFYFTVIHFAANMSRASQVHSNLDLTQDLSLARSKLHLLQSGQVRVPLYCRGRVCV